MGTATVIRNPARRIIITGCVGLTLGLPAAAAELLAVTTLVSDQGGMGLSDPDLVNPWGIAFSSVSPFWISDNGTGVSTVYSVNPLSDATTKVGLTVTIAGAGSVTGLVANPDTTTAFNGDSFLFVSEDGTVSGWRSALGTASETLVSASDAVYKGSAVGSVNGYTYLYAANFASGGIDVFKGGPSAPDLAGSFVDPSLPSGYGAFNVQQLGGELYVTYAQQGMTSGDEVTGSGLGIVDAFDLSGNFLRRVATGGTLNAPWGMALAPASWGSLGGKLLVGNFGDGAINAFDPATGDFAGQLMDAGNNPLMIDGLWALAPGNGQNAGSVDRIYFTAGPGDEIHGAFGVIAPVPLPAASALLVTAAIGLLPWCRRRAGGLY